MSESTGLVEGLGVVEEVKTEVERDVLRRGTHGPLLRKDTWQDEDPHTGAGHSHEERPTSPSHFAQAGTFAASLFSELAEGPEFLADAFATPCPSETSEEEGEEEEVQDEWHELDIDFGALFQVTPSTTPQEALANLREQIKAKLKHQMRPEAVLLRDKGANAASSCG